VSLEYIANRFRVLEVLGQGGMGTVYRVVDTLDNDERELALKTFRSDREITAERQLRFREEFRVMASLRHPNTVEVYDCGFIDGQTEYLAMAYVPGRELSELIAGRPLAFETIYELGLQLLLALEFIHSRLYVHRDIKPDNLRIQPDGTLKVMDFGLMEWVGSHNLGRVTGTVAYMAPEVILGGALDTASDLYSAGCVLFEMACQRPPFLGSIHEVFRAHIDQRPPSLRSSRADTPPGFEAIVHRLLAKNVNERYASAAEVVDELARLAGVRRVRQDLRRNESYLISDAMVGRRQEISALEDALADVEGGCGRSVFVVGPAGVGKSRLVGEILTRTKIRGMQVLHGQCKPGLSPYAPLLAALRPLLSLDSEDRLAEHRQLLVDIELAAERVRAGHEADVTALRDGIHAWLRAATESNPVVLALDDLQWCDRPSIELLNHFIRSSGDARLLFVATIRGEEAGLDSPVWITVQDGQTTRLDLGPLDRDQVRELVVSMLPQLEPDEAFVDGLYAATAGNAFFVGEVLRDLMEQGVLVASEGRWSLANDWQLDNIPDSVESVVQDRLARLDPEVLAVAQAAAILGPSLDREALLALTGVDEDQLFAAVDTLTERQFLSRADGHLIFPHDRVREALYDGIPDPELVELHRRVGTYLERRYAASIDQHLAELADHFGRGRDEAKTLDYTLRAGDQAKAAESDAAAIEYWIAAVTMLDIAELDGPLDAEQTALRFDLQARVAEGALALWPATTVDMAARCREALETRGDAERISKLMRFVVALIERSPSAIRTRVQAEIAKPPPVYRHELPSGLARHLPPPVPAWLPKLIETHALGCVASGHIGKPAQGLALGRRALALFPFSDNPLVGAMNTALAGCYQSAGHFDAMAEILVRARELLFDVDLGDQSVPRSARVGAAVFSNAGVFQGLRFTDELVDYGIWAADELHKPDFYNQVWIYPCLWYAWTGRDREASELLARIEDNCRQLGIPPDPWAQYLRPYLAWQRGALDEALALVSRALHYSGLERIRLAYEHAAVLEARILLDSGELDAAAEAVETIEARVREAGMDLLLIQALLARSAVALARGALDRASAPLVEAIELSAAGPARNPLHHGIALRCRAELERRTGQLDAAAATLAEARELIFGPEQDSLIEQGLLLRAEAELALASDQTGTATDALARAQTRFARIGNNYQVQLTRQRSRAVGVELEAPIELQPVDPHRAGSYDETIEVPTTLVSAIRDQTLDATTEAEALRLTIDSSPNHDPELSIEAEVDELTDRID